MKKIFVTGATGLLGANVVIKLLKDGYFVIALVRKESSYLGQKDENLKLITGDLFTDISELLTDVDCFIHIAAETRQDLFDYEEYKTVNYDAVIKLFTQAEASGVRRFILISSANTLGYGLGRNPEKSKILHAILLQNHCMLKVNLRQKTMCCKKGKYRSYYSVSYIYDRGI